MNKRDIFQVEKPWGNFRQFTHNDVSTVKILTLKPNQSLSLQSHKKREEFWKVIVGDGIIELDELKKPITVGDEYNVKIGMKHRLTAGQSGMQVLEIAFGDFDEEDIIRYEDNYGRV